MIELIMQAQARPAGEPFVSLLFLALIMLIFYLFLIRPQAKRAKELRRFIENAKPGFKIVTTGGIHGEIIKVYDNTFLIRTAGKTEIKVDKTRLALRKEEAKLIEVDR